MAIGSKDDKWPRRGALRGKHGLSVLVGVVVIALASAGCSDSPEVPLGPDGEPDSELVVGRDVYMGKCSSCHGAEGQGGRGKRLNNGQAVAQYPDPVDMEAVVAGGKGSGMPAFGDDLTDAEIAAVVRYIREVL